MTLDRVRLPGKKFAMHLLPRERLPGKINIIIYSLNSFESKPFQALSVEPRAKGRYSRS